MPERDPRASCCRGLERRASDDAYEVAGHARPHRPVAAASTSTGRTSRRRRARRSTPPRLLPPDEDEPADVFAAMRAGDMLVHHPYESFTASVERFIEPGRRRPRRPRRSSRPCTAPRATRPIVRVADPRRRARQAGRRPGRDQGALRRGGQHRLGAQARAGGRPRRLRPGRAQDALQGRARRPPRGHGLRRYVHIGTGNYNPKTAGCTWTSGCSPADPELGADVTDLFNVLTGLSRQRAFRRLLVAPTALRDAVPASWSSARSQHAAAGRPAGIVLKVNALVDAGVDRGAVRGVAGGRARST